MKLKLRMMKMMVVISVLLLSGASFAVTIITSHFSNLTSCKMVVSLPLLPSYQGNFLFISQPNSLTLQPAQQGVMNFIVNPDVLFTRKNNQFFNIKITDIDNSVDCDLNFFTLIKGAINVVNDGRRSFINFQPASITVNIQGLPAIKLRQITPLSIDMQINR